MRRIITGVFILVSMLFVSGAIISIYFRDKVKEYVLNEINSNLLSPVYISEIEGLSLFRNFPYASIELLDVAVFEPPGFNINGDSSDTLIFSKKLSLQFNVLDMLKKNYILRKIRLQNGFTRLKKDRQGNTNYDLFKKTGNKDDFLLKLDNLQLRDFRVIYSDEQATQLVDFTCINQKLKGNFSGTDYSLRANGDLHVNAFSSNNINYPANHSLSLILILDVDNTAETYSIRKADISIDHAHAIKTTGTIAGKENSTALDLEFSGEQLDIAFITKLLPEDQRKKLGKFINKGLFSFHCIVKGNMGKNSNPSVNADYKLTGGSVGHHDSKLSLYKISFTGTFTNGERCLPKTSVIDINRFQSSYGKGTINATARIANLRNPKLFLNLNSHADLSDLSSLLSESHIENLHGNAAIHAFINMPLRNNDSLSVKNLFEFIDSGNIVMKDVAFLLKKRPISCKNLRGTISLLGDNMALENIRATIVNTKTEDEDTIEINGLLRNIIPFLSDSVSRLIAEGTLSAEKLHPGNFFFDSGNDKPFTLSATDRVALKVHVNIGELILKKLTATQVSGNIVLRDGKITADQVSLNAMGGSMRGSLGLDDIPDKGLLFGCDAEVKNINIRRLFTAFGNFGQTVITDKHLAGELTTSLRLSLVFDSLLNLMQDKLFVIGDVSIRKGELIGFEPLQSVSGYIKSHKFLKLIIKADDFENRLKHITFSELKNQVEIKNKTVIIPAMTINSSAMQIHVSGTHNFNNEVDYCFSFFLSELFTKKEGKPGYDEFGEVEDDGTGRTRIFLTMKGTADQPVISYDRKAVKRRFNEELTKEKRTVKSILQEEFGWFSRDSLLFPEEKNKKPEFTIDWSENQPPPGSTVQPVKRNDTLSNNKFLHMLNKLGKEDSREKEDVDIGGEDY